MLPAPEAQSKSSVTVCSAPHTPSRTAGAAVQQPVRMLWQTDTKIAPQIDSSSVGSQESSSPNSLCSCLLFRARPGPKQVGGEPQGNQI